MSEIRRLVIPTENPSLQLRQYLPEEDAKDFFNLYRANRGHIEKYNTLTRGKHPDLASVERWMSNPSLNDVHLGMRYEETLIGSMNARRHPDRSVEMSCWVAEEHTGQGCAQAGVEALVKFYGDKTPLLRASVELGNVASQSVLEKVGFESAGIMPLLGKEYECFILNMA